MQTVEQLHENANRMRSNPTYSEKIAKKVLSDNKVNYLTQVVFGFYILDIVIPEKLLVIEIDGDTHTSVKQKEYDEARDKYCYSQGLRVLRLPNEYAFKTYEASLNYECIPNYIQKWEEALECAGKSKQIKLKRQLKGIAKTTKVDKAEREVRDPKKRIISGIKKLTDKQRAELLSELKELYSASL